MRKLNKFLYFYVGSSSVCWVFFGIFYFSRFACLSAEIQKIEKKYSKFLQRCIRTGTLISRYDVDSLAGPLCRQSSIEYSCSLFLSSFNKPSTKLQVNKIIIWTSPVILREKKIRIIKTSSSRRRTNRSHSCRAAGAQSGGMGRSRWKIERRDTFFLNP